MKAEAMSPRKRRRVHDVVEIMAPLKHDCLFPLTTPTCQWVGHAAPETDYDFSFACVFMCVCVCVCARVYWAVIEDVMQHRATRMRLQRQVCDIGIDLLEIKDSRTRIWWGWEKYMVFGLESQKWIRGSFFYFLLFFYSFFFFFFTNGK